MLNSTETATRSYTRLMVHAGTAERELLACLWDRMAAAPGDAGAAKAAARELGLDPRAAGWHARKLRGELPTGGELLELATATRAEALEAESQLHARLAARPDPYHPGAPTLPGNRSPSA